MAQLQPLEVININDLPPELVLQNQIFKRLSLADLLKAKRVCKLWNYLVSNIRIERLFVDVEQNTWMRWYHSETPFREIERCHPDLFVNQCKKPILSNLKFLKLDTGTLWPCALDGFDTNKFNTFRQLVQLEINYLPGHLNLCLPNLAVLCLDFNNIKYRIKLNLPKLQVLSYDENENHDLLRMEHPETVKVLESQIFGAKLARFKNVECLKSRHYDYSFLDRSTLLNLKQLKEVHYDYPIDSFAGSRYEEIMQTLKEFLKQKRELGRTDLKVYFSGLQLIAEDLSDIQFDSNIENGRHLVSTEWLYITHYDRLKNDMDLVWEVNYSRLFALTDRLPEDYFNRFHGIREVTAHCPVDEKHFLDFLKKLHCLKWLTLWDSNLSQAFFDGLPEFCSLSHLYLFETTEEDSETSGTDEEDEENEDEVENEEDGDETDREKSENESETDEENEESKTNCEESEESEIELNFDFLGKFVKLNHTTISKNLSLNSIRSFVPAFGNLREMMDKEIKFNFRGNKFTLGRNRPDYDENWKVIINERYNSYYLCCGKKVLLDEVNNLSQVVDFFENPENLESLFSSDSDDDSSNADEASNDSNNSRNPEDEAEIEN